MNRPTPERDCSAEPMPVVFVLDCTNWQIVESVMNWDRIAGNWKQFTGKAKEKWGKLTDDDWTVIAGKRDQFVGKVQERYGISKDEAEKQVAEFERGYEKV